MNNAMGAALAIIGLGIIVLLIFYVILKAQSRPNTSSRSIPMFNALGEEVRRSAEEGSFIHVAVGSGSIIGEEALISIGALEGLRDMSDLSAAYDTPLTITAGDPILYLMADDWMRRSYVKLGSVGRYRPTRVQFTAATPVTYAAMTALYLYDKKVGSNVMMGEFGQEVNLIAEAAGRRGTYSSGGVASPPAMAGLYPLLGREQLALGEELFAGAAEVTGRPIYRASLWAQDILRILLVFALFAGIFLAPLWK